MGDWWTLMVLKAHAFRWWADAWLGQFGLSAAHVLFGAALLCVVGALWVLLRPSPLGDARAFYEAADPDIRARLEAISFLWSGRQPQHRKVALQTLSRLWARPEIAAEVEPDPELHDPVLQAFYENHVRRAPYFRGAVVQRRVVCQLLEILDKEGHGPSVVRMEGRFGRRGDPELQNMPDYRLSLLERIPLSAHSVHVAELVIARLTAEGARHVIPDAMIAALAHDFGKLEGVRPELEAVGDHTRVGAVLDRVEGFRNLKHHDILLNAIKSHHEKPDERIARLVALAEREARENEETFVRQRVQDFAPAQAQEEAPRGPAPEDGSQKASAPPVASSPAEAPSEVPNTVGVAPAARRSGAVGDTPPTTATPPSPSDESSSAPGESSPAPDLPDALDRLRRAGLVEASADEGSRAASGEEPLWVEGSGYEIAPTALSLESLVSPGDGNAQKAKEISPHEGVQPAEPSQGTASAQPPQRNVQATRTELLPPLEAAGSRGTQGDKPLAKPRKGMPLPAGFLEDQQSAKERPAPTTHLERNDRGSSTPERAIQEFDQWFDGEWLLDEIAKMANLSIGHRFRVLIWKSGEVFVAIQFLDELLRRMAVNKGYHEVGQFLENSHPMRVLLLKVTDWLKSKKLVYERYIRPSAFGVPVKFVSRKGDRVGVYTVLYKRALSKRVDEAKLRERAEQREYKRIESVVVMEDGAQKNDKKTA